MTSTITSKRLTMGPFESSDFSDLVELHNDPLVMRYLNNGQPVPQTAVAEELQCWINGFQCGHGYGFYATRHTTTGRFVGWIHLRPGQGAGDLEPELGFRLHREFWGQGLAAEGSRALIDRGFMELSTERVYAHTMSVHRASRRALEKAGLRLVRTFRADWPVRIPGDEYGDVEYALTRAQWEADLRVP